MRLRLGLTLGAVTLAIGTSGGCNTGDDPHDFVVDNPGGANEGEGLTGGGDGGDPASGDDEGGGDDGGREISEADIVFVEGDRVYALSAYGGLVVVDASSPGTGLPVLGRYRMHAMPFEMYVDGGQVFVMTSDYGSYDYDEESGSYAWHSSSRLLALDASDPSRITSRGTFEMPGTIQDSRRVGDVLYLVTFEDGWCWGCQEDQPRTVVTSLDVSNPAQVQQVDQLAFDNQTDDEWDWAGPRSVSSTDERMYIGGIEYDDWESAHSTIDVIDISDPGGVMARGASLEIAGQIQSRWQMDEHEGALRVISQPWQWASDSPPVIQTFSVASATQIAPLASVPMQLPRPETLQSVRFDGDRGYAITFEQTDPLFAIDLSDPASPQQRGELEIPGWVYHMEPQGDRLLALGFDQGSAEGSINVSLFDVSNLDEPALLSRVAFGGDWASFAEDQNRIHKAFSILPELDLVLVPFSGWSYDDAQGEAAEWSCGSYQSGTQLIDWQDDALVRRGVAPSHGQSRRALVHRDRLLTMSDKSMQAFDIADRDAPSLSAQVALAANVSTVAAEGDIVVRLSQDWWTNETAIEVVSAADAEAAEPLGRLALAEVSDEFECNRSWPIDLFVHEGYAYLVRETYDLTTYEPRLVLDTIDVHDAVAPTWVGAIDLPFSQGWGGYYYGLGSTDERSVVLHGDALVFAASEPVYSGDEYVRTDARLEVVDLSAADAPEHTATLERPSGISHGSLQVLDGTLASWHMRAVDGDESKVRFFFDRFDVSSPASPHASPSINVPGQAVAYDAGHSRVVAVGFDLETIDVTDEECWSHPQQWGWDYDTGRCTIAHRPLHLLSLSGDAATLLDTLDVEGDEGRLVGITSSGDRVFAMIREGGWSWGVVSEDGSGASEPAELPSDVLAIVTGQGGSALDEASRVTVSEGGAWSWMTGAAGANALFVSDRGLGFVDATDAAEPRVTVVPTYGWGCYQPRVVGSVVYCPMYEYGLQAVAVP